MKCAPTKTPGKSTSSLREKYRQERDKRLRAKARSSMCGRSESSRTPMQPTRTCRCVPRDPISERSRRRHPGRPAWTGILAAYHLKKAGVTNFRNIDHAGDFGGVWYWNRYPGLQCDNDAYCYLPLLEETGLHAVEEILRRLGDLRVLPELIAQEVRLLREGAVPHADHRAALGRDDQALARQHQPRRRNPRPLRDHGQSAC